jgi:hypothetical protein
MESCGWEIRPAGRVLVVALAIVMIYFIAVSWKHSSEKNHPESV